MTVMRMARVYCNGCGDATFPSRGVGHMPDEGSDIRALASAHGWRTLQRGKEKIRDYCPECAGKVEELREEENGNE